MNIVNCIQGSTEWHNLRKERMTASHAQAIASNGKGLTTYITQLMQMLYSSAEPDNFKSKAMERGNELESSARFAYEAETNTQVDEIGFVIYDNHTGCSPDGVVNDGLVEIKCLEDKAYFNYLLSCKIDTGYEWQMQMQMLICEKLWCDYVVYNPNFKKSLIIKRVFLDAVKSEKLKQGFLTGIEIMNDIKNKLE